MNSGRNDVSNKSALSERMRAYECTFRQTLPRRAYTLMRLDVRSAHRLLRGAVRPFDMDFVSQMDEVAKALCAEITGTQFAYTQSDEISLLITDFDTTSTEPYFGGVVAKLLSVPPSLASVTLDRLRGSDSSMMPQFDCRVWSMSDPVEVANYFVERQRDAVRNSIQMLGQHYFTQSELNGKNTDEVQEMLFQQHSVNWNDKPAGIKRGRLISRKYIGMRWQVDAAPEFAAHPDNWLATAIPCLPSLM